MSVWVENLKPERVTLHCPRCGSTKLSWASGLPQLWSVFDCSECGYRGSLVVEDDDFAKRIKKRWLRSKSSKGKVAPKK